jgi:glycosyltransferase involved in cell wall biosynthesis
MPHTDNARIVSVFIRAGDVPRCAVLLISISELMNRPRILFICGRELTYPRNQVLHRALASFASLTTIGEDVYPPSLLRRSAKIDALAARALFGASFDYIFVGFYGYFVLPWVKVISRTPIIFDPFISNYDTLVHDRHTIGSHSFRALAARAADTIAVNWASHNLLDTQAHIDYFVREYGVPADRFSRVFVSCDERLFSPLADVKEENEVLFYGTYLPIHGIDVIVKAAQIVGRSSSIRFRLVGNGQEFSRIKALAANLGVHNVSFVDPVRLQDLPHLIARAKICLGGHFGRSEKAGRVIAGKTFQCIAMQKPTIVGDNAANGELLTHQVDAWFCKMNDPQELADSILYLEADERFRRRLGENARATYLEKASPMVVEKEMRGLFASFSPGG